jgi:hypothetical protein
LRRAVQVGCLWKDRTSLGISMARICSKCLRPQLFGAQLYATAKPLVENLVGDLKTSREVYVFGTVSRLEALVDCFAMTSELPRYRASPRAVVESKFGAILRFLMRRCRDSKLWFGKDPSSPRQATGDIQSGRALYLVLWLGSTESRCGSLFRQSTAHCPTPKVDTIGRLEMVE